MKKFILILVLAVAGLVSQAAEVQYFSLIGQNNGVKLNTINTTLTVTNGTVGYTYLNSLSNQVVAGQYSITNLFTNGALIYTNYGPYQAGAFQDVQGASLSTAEPMSGALFSDTVGGTDAGSTNTVTFIVQKSPDGINWGSAGSAPTFTWAHVAMGTTNQTFVTNAPTGFMQGGKAFRVLSVATGSTGSSNTVLEVGLSMSIR